MKEKPIKPKNITQVEEETIISFEELILQVL